MITSITVEKCTDLCQVSVKRYQKQCPWQLLVHPHTQDSGKGDAVRSPRRVITHQYPPPTIGEGILEDIALGDGPGRFPEGPILPSASSQCTSSGPLCK